MPVRIRHLPEHRGADAADAEREARRTGPRSCRPCPAPAPARRRGSPRTPTRGSGRSARSARRVQNRFACGSSSVNGSTPRIENQMTYLRPMRSPMGPPTSVPTATAAEEHEQVHLRALHRHVEAFDQVERVVAGQARQVDVLREDQRDQHRQRADARLRVAAARTERVRRSCARPRSRACRGARTTRRRSDSSTMPSSAASANQATLPCPLRQHDERREQRTDRRARVAADLEHRLREAMTPARRHPRDARGLGMEHRRADADAAQRPAAAAGKVVRGRQQQQARRA